MTKLAETIFEQAKALSNAERSELAEMLLGTVETIEPSGDPAYRAAWEAEIAKRAGERDRGEVQGVPWEIARKQIFGKSDE